MLMPGPQDYLRMEATTADSKNLAIMCLEKMIRNLMTVRKEYASNSFDLNSEEIQNTVNILTELRCNLDFFLKEAVLFSESS
jgi:flagellin-specific chaperone FliS